MVIVYAQNEPADSTLKRLSQAIERNPDNPLLYVRRGCYYTMCGKPELAVADHSSAIKLAPNYLPSYFHRADAYENLKQFERAIANYTYVIENAPGEPLSDTYYNGDDEEDDETDGEHEHEHISSEAVAYSSRGKCYYAIQRYGLAVADFTAAIALNSTATAANYLFLDRGKAHYEMGDYTKAALDFQAFIAGGGFAQDVEEGYLYLAKSYIKLEQYEQAIETYTKAINWSRPPHGSRLFIDRGNAYKALKQYEQAMDDYSEAIRRVLGLWQQNDVMADNYGISKEMIAGILRVEQNQLNVHSDPNLRIAYANRANTFYQMAHYEKAIEDYSQAIELAPTNADYINMRGNAFYRLKRYEEAINDFSRAIELGHSHFATYGTRGLAYANVGQLDEAIADFKRALELEPDNSGTLYNVAVIYGRKHEQKNAFYYLQRALQLNPQLRENARDPEDFGWLVKHDPQFAAEFQRLVYA